MRLYNSASREKEIFVPRFDGKVSMYTCGPTVYHFAHIGNLRSYIMEDVLEKYLRYVGYDVTRVMNITDVGHLTSDADTGEDKMLKGAKREHKTVMEIAKFYTDAFFADCAKLNIKTPDVIEPATNCISEFIEMIKTLLEKGYAYEAGGNIYFDTSKLEKYYVFNDFTEEDLDVGVRDTVEADNNKKNKADFVLWFTKSKFEDQELKWDSPFGVGYPGWHIECSCIAKKHLGYSYDFTKDYTEEDYMILITYDESKKNVVFTEVAGGFGDPDGFKYKSYKQNGDTITVNLVYHSYTEEKPQGTEGKDWIDASEDDYVCYIAISDPSTLTFKYIDGTWRLSSFKAK